LHLPSIPSLGIHETFFHPPAKRKLQTQNAQPTKKKKKKKTKTTKTKKKKKKKTRITAPLKVRDPEEILRKW